MRTKTLETRWLDIPAPKPAPPRTDQLEMDRLELGPRVAIELHFQGATR